MISKIEAKYIQSLHAKKNRDKEGVFVAEGEKVVQEFLKEKIIPVKLFATEKWALENKTIQGNFMKIASEDELQKAGFLKTPNQVLAIFPQQHHLFIPSKNKWILMLDEIQDPGNMGNMIRTADWFGWNHIIASKDCVDQYNPKVVQASMGSLSRIRVQYEALDHFLRETDLPVLGATLSGENIITLPKEKTGILIIGNEGKGIHENLKPFISKQITIPRIGKAESLNAATAFAIIASHLMKG
ncbi:MAG: RNA methyltransferase [Bacteroidetes bacterium]|nr:RNA methyltransferase [Bacteroidota bacterium]